MKSNRFPRLILAFLLCLILQACAVSDTSGTQNENAAVPVPYGSEPESAVTEAPQPETLTPEDTTEADTQISWQEFLNGVVTSRDWKQLLDYELISVNEVLIDRGEVIAEGGNLQYNPQDIPVGAYMVDTDTDGSNELFVRWRQGVFGRCFTEIYKNLGDRYIFEAATEGDVLPILYGDNLHYIGLEKNPETKFVDSVTEYAMENYRLKKQDIIRMQYSYDVTSLRGMLSKFDIGGFINSLGSYPAPEEENNGTTGNHYDFALPDGKNGKMYNFSLRLSAALRTDRPKSWILETDDVNAQRLSGIEKILTNEADTDILYGVAFLKDEQENVFILKVSYPGAAEEVTEDIPDEGKDGKLALQLYELTEDAVLKVDSAVISPQVGLTVENVARYGNLYGAGESVVFSFKDAGSDRLLTVCISDGPKPGLVYRFGTKDNMELEYPGDGAAEWTSFTYAENSGSASLGYNALIFENEGFRYEVYQINVPGGGYTAGVTVDGPGTENDMDVRADPGSLKGSLSELAAYFSGA